MHDDTIVKYIDNDGCYCPYCEADITDLGTMKYDMLKGRLFLPAKCSTCKREWVEEYALVTIHGGK